ncbi:AfsR/SARP family transcriptional regulator [Rugosimonospora africana]|uniref:OmpR/PhoB-type domain-containing protein n=1 Tax=Rugosimonospora africana TaxID=556532 RepID=A0A8J3VST6_9ACTN|nr:BTAD domain-containing putative transcriptional regulator [Rugosimonospora africana]GIH16813.1 hypothetical protein Raf01_49850 [Rugosimonospora africana]
MRLRILGPVEVWVNDSLVPVRRPRQRATLAYLLLHANRTVSTAMLIDALWGDAAPATARAQVQADISALRRTLADAGADRTIESRPAGYRAVVDPAHLDYLDFTGRVAEARESPDPDGGAAALRRALDLWQGPALADVDAAYVPAARVHLDEQRIAAYEQFAELELTLGRHFELATELAAVVAANPIRERLRGQLMLALHRSGRTADALAVARELRALLTEQQGLDPGPAIVDLERRILRADATVGPAVGEAPASRLNGVSRFVNGERALSQLEALAADERGEHGAVAVISASGVSRNGAPGNGAPGNGAPGNGAPGNGAPGNGAPGSGASGNGNAATPPRPATGEPAGASNHGPARVVPAQLPPDVSAFTGRDEQLAALDAILAGSTDQPTAVVIAAVSGTAGVGKTALAVRWAHGVKNRFPDGQLYLNLRGYDPDRPTSPADALTRLLTALDVSARDIPAEVEDQAARYRTQTADRRILILLDNAASVEQVRPLLPGGNACMVLVTSRDRLGGLVAVNGAHRVDLDVLSVADAHTLLRRLIGPRADADPTSVAALAELCARLPLALRVAAQLAASLPVVALAQLIAELADHQRRLELLDAGDDPRANVAAVFSWSVRHLPPPAARTFGLLGLHPGPDFDSYATACLAGTGVEDARRTLRLLTRANLIFPTGPGRAGMHDLLRAYARSLAVHEPAHEPANGTADDAAESPRDDPRAVQGRLFDYYLTTAASAIGVLYPFETPDESPFPPAATPAPVFDEPGTARDWLDAERACLAAIVAYTAAHGWPNHAIHLPAVLFRHLGGGHPADALAMHGHARTAARQVNDRNGEALALNGLGAACLYLGRYGSAIEHYERALALFRELGDQAGEARALNNLGAVLLQLGEYEPAALRLRDSLELFRRLGHVARQGTALTNLGVIEAALGRSERGAEYHREALALHRRTGNPTGEARALTDLGIVEQQLGEHEQAAADHRRALTLFLEAGDRHGETWARNGLGECALAAGDPDEAVAQHTAALDIANRIGACDQKARAQAGLSAAHRALDDPMRGSEHLGKADAIDCGLDRPDGDQR